MGQIYSQLTDGERNQFYALRQAQRPMTEIANQLGRSRATLYNELNRNTGGRGYRPHQAQQFAENRRVEKVQPLKMHPNVTAYIESKLQLQWSPEQIASTMKTDPDGPGLAVKRLGDWEADLVCGTGASGYLVTLVERRSRRVLIGYTRTKTANEVTAEILRLLKDQVVKTISFDNGKEFAGHERIATELDCQCYFAKPYHSWERGVNENTNGLIRQYFPKKMSFAKISADQIALVEHRLNTRPRKCLGFKPPNGVYFSLAA